MYKLSARQEFAVAWPLPLVALIGLTGAMIPIHLNGVLIGPITKAFGWSHTQFSTGLAIQSAVQLLLAPFVGRCIDRFGPRKVILAGLAPYVMSIALLGTTNGDVWHWRALCLVQGIVSAFIAAPAWMTAVVSRFDSARGLAVAITLAGVAVAGMILPISAAFFLELLGWRLTFGALVASWAIIVAPLVFLFFFGRSDLPIARAQGDQRKPAPPQISVVLATLHSRAVISVVVAGMLFLTVSLGLTLHTVPILTGNGLPLRAAAAAASIGGFCSLIGRLGTGLLLDRIPARHVGAIAFTLPIIAVLLLLQHSPSFWLSGTALAVLGLAAGAETDIVTYMLSRRVPTEIFGSAYAIVTAAFSVCATGGPLIASALYDLHGNYDLFLLAAIPTVLAGAILIWTIPSSSHAGIERPMAS